MNADQRSVLSILADYPCGLHVWDVARGMQRGLLLSIYRGRAGRILSELEHKRFVARTEGRPWHLTGNGMLALDQE